MSTGDSALYPVFLGEEEHCHILGKSWDHHQSKTSLFEKKEHQCWQFRYQIRVSNGVFILNRTNFVTLPLK